MRYRIFTILAFFCTILCHGEARPDYGAVFNSDSIVIIADSLENNQPVIRKKQAPQRLTVVKREFKYRRQVGLALFMMAFVALFMTTAQTWNPD